MAKSELFPSLEDISFAEKNPDNITREILERYTALTGRSLAPADPIRLFLDSIILAIIQQRNIIDIAAKNNLLAYATGSYLDHIGALLGVTRLTASHATCTVKFTLSTAKDYPVIIPVGTRISAGSNIYFAVNETHTIPAGDKSITVSASCTTAGEAGNGYIAGQVNRLVDVFPYEMSVENVNETSGGADVESDEAFRERIQIAPESFSTAGPVKAYEYFARSAHQDIISVSVIGPPETLPGHVEIYPLMTGGELPSDEVIEAVQNICAADDVRPDTDYVQVLKPEVVNYDLSITYWIDSEKSVNAWNIQSYVYEAVQSWVKWQKSELGRDINPSELNRRVIDAGAKRCEIVSPGFRVLKKSQVAVCGELSVIFGGLEEG